jgi:MFS family permease
LTALRAEERAFRRVLVLLFAIQFFSWSGMFALWICAVPFVAAQVLHVPLGGATGMQSALIAVSLCFTTYATLGALGGLALPRLVAGWGHAAVYAAGLTAGAVGLFLLSQSRGPALLVPAFIAIGLGWSAIGSLPYAILGKLAPEGRGARYMRVFSFSTVLPQAVTTLLYAVFAQRWVGERLDLVLLAGAGVMAVAALLAIAARSPFAAADLVSEDW